MCAYIMGMDNLDKIKLSLYMIFGYIGTAIGDFNTGTVVDTS